MIRTLFIIILVFGEIFSLIGVKFLLKDAKPITQKIAWIIYWLWTIGVLLAFGYLIVNQNTFSEIGQMNTAFVVLGVILMNVLFKFIFGGIHFLNEGATWIANKLQPNASGQGNMSRSKFLSLAGLALASIPFSGFLWGMIAGRYQFKVFHTAIAIPNLPNNFIGKKIIQISDFHLGSFPLNDKHIAEAITKINELEPDYIFFTGDMINERAKEAEPWVETLAKLSAKSGMYSVLGNHDYGDYYAAWDGKPDKIEDNVQHLKQLQAQMGFQLLRNENRILQQGDDQIRLIGLENWGAGHFSKYGDMDKATQGVTDDEVQILLSHDPTHWDEHVLGKYAVDLALAGHTHGSQMGIETPAFRWSPAQYIYKRWAGLYKVGQQQLYVNRGIGYIGYAGRIGMPPEITCIELQKG